MLAEEQEPKTKVTRSGDEGIVLESVFWN